MKAYRVPGIQAAPASAATVSADQEGRPEVLEGGVGGAEEQQALVGGGSVVREKQRTA
jgi:hypothetical protein